MVAQANSKGRTLSTAQSMAQMGKLIKHPGDMNPWPSVNPRGPCQEVGKRDQRWEEAKVKQEVWKRGSWEQVQTLHASLGARR